MTFDEAVDFCKNSPEIAATILIKVAQLEENLIKANAEIKRLREIINKDSSNSSKPPSTDNKLKKKPTSKKNTIKKRRGGQQGHSGRTLKMVENPDKVIVLEVDTCSCGQSLDKIDSSKVIKRQSFDLPKIKMMVTQFNTLVFLTKVLSNISNNYTHEILSSKLVTCQNFNKVKRNPKLVIIKKRNFMPKIFEYLGIIIMFYSNEHEPIHVHGKFQALESKAEFIIVDGKIVEIKITDVKGKKPLSKKELKEFKNFVNKFKNDIVQKWIDYFVYHKSIECIKIEGKVK